MIKTQKIDVYGLNFDEIQELRQIAQEKYGKASVSLLAKKLLQQQIKQSDNIPENMTNNFHQEIILENKRLTLRLPPKQYIYLAKKSKLQHSSLNDIVRDIITEHITNNPVLSNDEVQALYQSNYQLLRIGRNINQLARNFNAIMPQSLTTQQLTEIAEYLDFHTDLVGKFLRNQGKPFKYRAIFNPNQHNINQINKNEKSE